MRKLQAFGMCKCACARDCACVYVRVVYVHLCTCVYSIMVRVCQRDATLSMNFTCVDSSLSVRSFFPSQIRFMPECRRDQTKRAKGLDRRR